MISPADTTSPPSRYVRGLTVRSFLIGLVLLFLSVLWVRQVELITFTCQITESIPPIPAIAVLLLFLVLRPLLPKLGGWFNLSRAEIGVVFLFVGLGSLMSAVGVTQAILPYLTVPFYFASPENDLGQLAANLPDWLGPRSPATILGFYEGSPGGVPWGEWARPLAVWGAFLIAYWWTALCMWAAVRKQWTERERLTFPLLYLPLSLTETERPDDGAPPFFKNPLTWVGFAAAVTYNGFNILHALNPNVAALGVYYPLGSVFTERPLSAMSGMQIWYRPELVGFGYLVSLEILFSTWVFYLLENGAAVFGAALGYDRAGFPFVVEQGMGAYGATGLFLLWMARRQLAAMVKRALGIGAYEGEREEPLTCRVVVFGGLAGFAFLVLFARAAGMNGWVALAFFAYLLLFALVYGRIRAETGTPSVWTLSHSNGMSLPFYTFGSDFFKFGGSIQTLSLWTNFFFLVHGGFFNQCTAYGIESFKLADEMRMPRRQMVYTSLLAVVLGLLLAYWMFLTTYYKYGANVLAGGQSDPMGGVRIRYCLQAWQQTAGYLKTPRLLEWNRNAATGAGFLLTLGMIGARGALLKFPLNPLGYILATIIGSQVWWAFLVAWLLKSLVLHLGGVQLYKKLIPAFVGLALGQFFAAGIVWGSIAGLWPHAQYVVWFT